jgi:hypothetical protein
MPPAVSELQVQNDILNAVILDSKGNVLHPILNLDQTTYKFSVPTLDENTSYFTHKIFCL